MTLSTRDVNRIARAVVDLLRQEEQKSELRPEWVTSKEFIERVERETGRKSSWTRQRMRYVERQKVSGREYLYNWTGAVPLLMQIA